MSRGRRHLSFLILIFSGFLCGQSSPQKPPQSLSQVVTANTRFAFKFFDSLTAPSPDRNILLAPTGLSLNFALLDNGADPDTRKEIENAFELTGLALPEINAGFASLREELQLAKAPKVTTRPYGMTPAQWKEYQKAPPDGTVIADSIWTRNVVFPAAFRQTNKRYYGADLKRLLPSPSPSEQVSRWATLRTKKVVRIHLGAMARNDLLVVDVTHFHRFWNEQFSESETKPATFTLLSGKDKQVSMMHQQGKFMYFEGPNFQAIILPYYLGESMYVFLPSKDSSLSEFEKSLTPANWQDWMTHFESRPGLLGLPRFQIETGFDVRAALEGLGVKRAFESFAAFSPIVPLDGLKLTSAIQKTSLKVDEQGTEATSVSIMMGVIGGIMVSQGPPPKPFEMIVNRPFFFAIENNQTQQLLFLGAVVEP